MQFVSTFNNIKTHIFKTDYQNIIDTGTSLIYEVYIQPNYENEQN